MINPQRSLSELPKMSAASQVERAVLVSCMCPVALYCLHFSRLTEVLGFFLHVLV